MAQADHVPGAGEAVMLDELAEIDAAIDAALARSQSLLDEARGSFRNSRSPVSIQPRSANSKLARQKVEIAKSKRKRFVPVGPYMASTYVSIAATCPDSCEFKAGGCFAQAGASHLTMNGLNRAALGMAALDVTLAEAAAIDALCSRGVPKDGHKGTGRALRLHVGGEVSCTAGARALAAAAERWLARGGGPVWTFTHRWKWIPREAWGPISVMASCKTHDEIEQAARRGYAPSTVVPRFPNGQRPFGIAGRRGIPCLNESGAGLTCAECQLCLHDTKLLASGRVIVLEAHGRDEEDAAAVLVQIRKVDQRK